jgi:hypothetical protein
LAELSRFTSGASLAFAGIGVVLRANYFGAAADIRGVNSARATFPLSRSLRLGRRLALPDDCASISSASRR